MGQRHMKENPKPETRNPILCGLCVLLWLIFLLPSSAVAALSLNWTNNLLTVSGPNLPGGKLEILYLEAFCRKGATGRDWKKTVLPHKTKLISAQPQDLELLTTVEASVEMRHEIRAHSDEVEFHFVLKNLSEQPVDLDWFEPACIRVDRFTGLDQNHYIEKSFIYTERGLTTLDKTQRREEALYHGGQLYVPKGIDLRDINPRPISPEQPVNGLIGCFSADNRYLLATASDSTHELFQGVYVCLHSDPHVGGLGPRETKKFRAKLYLLKNDSTELLKRYERDFGGH